MTETVDQRPTKLKLTLYQPELAPEAHEFEEGPVSLGRSPDCRLPIRDRFLSRHHAELVKEDDGWSIVDTGSANGTFVNGVKIDTRQELYSGDRISIGDSQIVVADVQGPQSGSFSIEERDSKSNISIPIAETMMVGGEAVSVDRLQILNQLAVDLLADRPLEALFDFIVDRVLELMAPSRVAIGILRPGQLSFQDVRIRSSDGNDELSISRTLLSEVVEHKRALAYTDIQADEALAQAKSIVGQEIRSALCAPLVAGEDVLGVLYLDYQLSQRYISEDDVKLATRIAKLAGVKLETTKLREEAVEKHRMDEELKTAYVVQSRLLPDEPPEIEGWDIAGLNRPARGVSGDYYDFKLLDDGRLWFIIADVSGKGITAAIVMASLATSFSIFTRESETPAQLVHDLNQTLTPKTAPTKFVTLFVGLLDPASGRLVFTNAGHVPPLVIRADGVEQLSTTDMIVGLFTQAQYRDQEVTLQPGDGLVTFTDCVIEAENESGEEMGVDPVVERLGRHHGESASKMISVVEEVVNEYAGDCPLGDDLTFVSLHRH